MQNNSNAHKKSSEVIQDVILSIGREGRITIREILVLLGQKSFCMAILVLALPNCIPVPNPPGFATLTGLPISLLAIQIFLGHRAPWLPNFINNCSISRYKFIKFLEKALPYIKKIERVFYPRLLFISTNISKKILGLTFFVLGFVLSLPIPFANLLPGFSILFISIGFMEKDGVMMIAGLIFGAASCYAIFASLKAVFIAVLGYLV